MSLRQFAREHSVFAAIVCAVTQMLLTIVILKIGFGLVPPEDAGIVKLVAFASTIAWPLVLVQVLGLWRDVGFGLRGVRISPPFLAAIAVCALWLIMGIHPQENGSIANEVPLQLANAFGEELLFRGVIFALLLSLPVGRAIALNALLFGSMHLIHGYMDGDWGAALHQAFFTVMGGTLFAAARYSTGSLWLVILLHAGLNLCIIYSNIGSAAGPSAEQAMTWIAGLAELAIAGWVIWRCSRQKAVSAAS